MSEYDLGSCFVLLSLPALLIAVNVVRSFLCVVTMTKVDNMHDLCMYAERLPWKFALSLALVALIGPHGVLFYATCGLLTISLLLLLIRNVASPGEWLVVLFPSSVLIAATIGQSFFDKILKRLPIVFTIVVGLVALWMLLLSVLRCVLYPAPFVTIFLNLDEKRRVGFELRPFENVSITMGSQIVGRGPFARGKKSPVLDAVVLRRSPPKGSAKWIVYISGNDDYYEKVFDKLGSLFDCSCDASVLSYNPRGVGRSTGFSGSASDLVDDAASVIRHLVKVEQTRQEDIVVFGHSLGGGVGAQLVAVYFPQLSLVVDRSFSTFSDAATALSFFPLRHFPSVVRYLVRCSFGDLDSISAWRNVSHPRKLVTFHAKDHVILHQQSSIAANKFRAQLNSNHPEAAAAIVVEYGGTAVDHHDCNAAELEGFDEVMRRVVSMFQRHSGLP